MPRGTPHDPDFKPMVVEEASQPGVTGRSVAEKYDISQSMVSRWVREAATVEPEVPSDLIETIESEISSPAGLIIPDSKNRIILILALLESGYTVSMENDQVYYDR